MRIIRLMQYAAGAAGLMLAGAGILAMPGGEYVQAARADSQSRAVSMHATQSAPGAPKPKIRAVPASLPSKNAAAPAHKSGSAAAKKAAARAAAALRKANARELFAAVKTPANFPARPVGFYSKGCLAGGKPLPVNGPAWQVMRLSRNRMWGHPSLIRYIERFAQDAKEKDGWPGLLIGDLSMPRGGPMPSDHVSHQVGLDVDIWYKPVPDHELSAAERESMEMESFLLDPGHVNPAVWKPGYEKLLRRAVSYPEVARIFVNPAIKKWLCDNSKGNRSYLRKVTAIMGHDAHFHVRLSCPAGTRGCENQVLKGGEGCGKGLDQWIAKLMKQAKPVPATKFATIRAKIAAWKRKLAGGGHKRKPPYPMGRLPAECQKVLKAEPLPVLDATAAR